MRRSPNEHLESQGELKPVAEKQEEQIQTAVRLPKSLLSDVDKLANQMSTPGVNATRSEALRFALRHGVNNLLLPQHTKPKSKKR
jgi:hypothetical protein